MHKCYTFLIFMVLLLPSLGLSRWVSEEGMGAGVWNCLWGRGSSGSHLLYRARGPMSGGHPQSLWMGLPLPWCSGPFQLPHTPPLLSSPLLSSPFLSPPLLSSLDLFFRWLFDKKFLAEAAIRFE